MKNLIRFHLDEGEEAIWTVNVLDISKVTQHSPDRRVSVELLNREKHFVKETMAEIHRLAQWGREDPPGSGIFHYDL